MAVKMQHTDTSTVLDSQLYNSRIPLGQHKRHTKHTKIWQEKLAQY